MESGALHVQLPEQVFVHRGNHRLRLHLEAGLAPRRLHSGTHAARGGAEGGEAAGRRQGVERRLVEVRGNGLLERFLLLLAEQVRPRQPRRGAADLQA